MADKSIPFPVATISLILGLGFVLNTNLIPSLPVMFHWLLGGLFLILGGYIIGYKII